MKRGLNRRYVDNRLTDDIWLWYTPATGAEKSDVNRETRIRITPKAEAWATTQNASCYYSSPTGELVKKIIYDWNEVGANFKTYWWNVTDGVTAIQAGTGNGTGGVYAPTSVKDIFFVFEATGNLTPTSDGAYYGQVDDLRVYAKTNNSGNYADDLYKIACDVVASITSLNADITKIGLSASPLTLIPFVTEGYEMAADILTRAAEKGDAAGARWACYLDDSEKATTPDGKPVLVVEAQPLLTDYEYIIYYDSPNLVPSLQTTYTSEDVWNYIIVRYTDEDGREQFITPAGATTGALTDATSVATYGRREYVLDAGESLGIGDLAACTAYIAGLSFLAAYKNPRWKISSAITVRGYIQAKNGSLIPACEIRAGKRIKLGTYVDDGTGTWLTFLISQTSYNDESQECSITIGPPPELNLPTFSFPELPPVDEKDKTKKKGRKKPRKPGPGWVWNETKWKWVKK